MRPILLPIIFGSMAVGGTGAWIWLRRHRPTAEALERERRLRLNSTGRLANGEIVDLVPAPVEGPPTVVYQYEVSGVSYQVSQELHLVPIEFDPASWIPGWPVQVKYDPALPGNSIVACEYWMGMSARARAGSPS